MVHQIGAKLRVQIHGFSGKLCIGMGKVLGMFVEEMIYDIQARVSVRLSEVGRSLMEKTSLKKGLIGCLAIWVVQGWRMISVR